MLEKIRENILLIVFSSYHLLLTLLGFIYYPGSSFYFTIFSLSYYILIIWNNRKTSSPSIMFLSWMIWLGFFQKIVFHLFTNFQFMTELIGQFQGTSNEWDQVLQVATLAAVGLTITTFLFNYLKAPDNYFSYIPGRYTKINFKTSVPVVAGILVLIVLAVATINVILGINLSGLVAMTVLHWPLNALIGWLLYLGFAIAFVFIIDWEFSTRKKLTLSFLFFSISAFLCSVSIISRGLFVFHLAPIIYLIYRNRKEFKISIATLSLLTFTVVILFIFNTVSVTMMRNYFYNNNFSNNEWIQKEWIMSGNRQTKLNRADNDMARFFDVFENKEALSQVAGLVVNRWIGAEGVMAVISYPEKGFYLIKQTLLRKPAIGEFDLYESIVKSQYTLSKKFSFANIPGPAAFFLYSGSLLFVFFGFVFFAGLLLSLDMLVWSCFKNSFLSALIGFYLANSVAQFGISPRPLLISVAMTFTGLMAIYALFLFLKSKYFKTFSTK